MLTKLLEVLIIPPFKKDGAELFSLTEMKKLLAIIIQLSFGFLSEDSFKQGSISEFKDSNISKNLTHRPSKMKFFGVKGFFSCIIISKMAVKMNFRMITKNHATDSKKGSP